MTDAPESDALYLELVDRVARGKPTPWRLDKRYPTEGSPEARYSGGGGPGFGTMGRSRNTQPDATSIRRARGAVERRIRYAAGEEEPTEGKRH